MKDLTPALKDLDEALHLKNTAEDPDNSSFVRIGLVELFRSHSAVLVNKHLEELRYLVSAEIDSPTRRCHTCGGPRRGLLCWKCGAATTEVVPQWTDTMSCSLSVLMTISRDLGYALTRHGSGEQDIDLVAIPWVEDCQGPQHFITLLRERHTTITGLLTREVGLREEKPHGRIAVTLQLDGWYKGIDLSVMPRLSNTNEDHIE